MVDSCDCCDDVDVVGCGGGGDCPIVRDDEDVDDESIASSISSNRS